jgi:hypothetical protein
MLVWMMQDVGRYAGVDDAGRVEDVSRYADVDNGGHKQVC